MTMVEKIAREIEPLSWAALGAGDTLAHKERRTSSLRKAKRILETLLEPTAEMQKAMPRQSYTIEHYHGSGHSQSFPTLGSGPLAEWRAMITKALSEADELCL